MSFDTWTLEEASIRLIDGDRGKNYPKQADFNHKGHCLFLSAKNVTSTGFQFSETVFIGEDKHNLLRAGTLNRHDIVLTTRGTIGNVALYDNTVDYPTVRINSGMIIIRVDPAVWNPRFLYYVFTSDLVINQITSLTSGSAVPQLPARDLKKFVLPKIPLDVQDEIETIISALSDKLRLNHQINQTLEQLAQAIFKSWFVDFEPVKAKIAALEAGGSAADAELAAMQTISGKNSDQLQQMASKQPEKYAELRATAELFPSAMQESELGEIPEGWESVQVGDIIQRLKPSKRYTKKQVSQYGNTPVFEQGAGILLGFHNDEPGFKASAEDPVFIFGDHTCVTHLSCQGFDISQNVIPLKGSIRPTVWSYYAILGKQTFQEYRRHWSEFAIKPVTLPNQALCQRFSDTITDGLLLTESLGKESKELENIRDTLLPKLLSGDLTLPEIDSIQDHSNV